MPLRDYFRPPVFAKSSWEGFHGMWPALIVQFLVRHSAYEADDRRYPDAELAEPYEYSVEIVAYCELAERGSMNEQEGRCTARSVLIVLRVPWPPHLGGHANEQGEHAHANAVGMAPNIVEC